MVSRISGFLPSTVWLIGTYNHISVLHTSPGVLSKSQSPLFITGGFRVVPGQDWVPKIFFFYQEDSKTSKIGNKTQKKNEQEKKTHLELGTGGKKIFPTACKKVWSKKLGLTNSQKMRRLAKSHLLHHRFRQIHQRKRWDRIMDRRLQRWIVCGACVHFTM